MFNLIRKIKLPQAISGSIPSTINIKKATPHFWVQHSINDNGNASEWNRKSQIQDGDRRIGSP
jgi:hypothetical protein